MSKFHYRSLFESRSKEEVKKVYWKKNDQLGKQKKWMIVFSIALFLIGQIALVISEDENSHYFGILAILMIISYVVGYWACHTHLDMKMNDNEYFNELERLAEKPSETGESKSD